MKAVAERHGFGFPYLFDETQDVARAYGAVCTPDFFGYDRDLRLAYRGRLDDAGSHARREGNRRELFEAMRAVARRRGGARGAARVDRLLDQVEGLMRLRRSARRRASHRVARRTSARRRLRPAPGRRATSRGRSPAPRRRARRSSSAKPARDQRRRSQRPRRSSPARSRRTPAGSSARRRCRRCRGRASSAPTRR